jgi:hypothetical protein
MKIEEMANQIEANGDCLRSFAKVMKVIETRDAEQLAVVLGAFLENEDPGNTSFAEIALPLLAESLAGQDGKEPVPSAGELGNAMEWFIRTSRVKHGPGRDRDEDYKFVTRLLGAIKDRDNFPARRLR